MRLVLIALALVACGGEPVGRLCDLGGTAPQPSEVVVASPSLDCITRTCLRYPLSAELPIGATFPGGTLGLCTAECASDDDCERVPESPCVSGFTCGIATQVGPYCCRKLCICKDYVAVPPSGVLPMPAACDPANADNTCGNL
jgi:hypothetical protein